MNFFRENVTSQQQLWGISDFQTHPDFKMLRYEKMCTLELIKYGIYDLY